MKRDELKKLGLEDAHIDSIMKMYGESVNSTKSELETLKAENTAFKKTIDEANATIDGYKQMNIEQIKKSADEWKSKYENDIKAKDLEIAKVQKNSAVELELAKYKPKNAATFRKLLDLEKVELKEGKLVGLEEQVKGLKESEPYLFNETQVKNSGVEANLPDLTGKSKEDRDILQAMGLNPDKPK